MTLPTVCSELGLPKLRILIVEDDEVDYLQTVTLLRGGGIGELELTWKQGFEDALRAMVNNTFDICILDYRLDGKRNGLDLIWEAGDSALCPIIMLTGAGGHQIDVRAMKAGVADYFEKGCITSEVFARSIRFAIHRDRIVTDEVTETDDIDLLTGFDNPSIFLAKFESALTRAQRERTRLALLTIDLDGFKNINAQYGYGCGDEILAEVAERLRHTIRECDHVGKTQSTSGRVGSDVFSIVLEGITLPENIEAVGEKIIQALATGDYHIDGNRKKVHMDVSIGCAFFPDDGHKTENLVDFAELALLRAKSTDGSALLTYNHFGTAPLDYDDRSGEVQH